MTTWFTPSTARAMLRGPLVFGDPTTIEAMQYLRDLAAARKVIAGCSHEPCKECWGTGSMSQKGKNHGLLCDECGGDGTEDYCRCFDGMNRFAVRDARARLVRSRK